MGAVLACGPGSAASHLSASALLGLSDRAPVVVDVIALGKRGAGVDGVKAHRVLGLRRDEVGSVAGIPCTGPSRTLVNLAGTVGDRTPRGAFEVAACRRQLDLDALEPRSPAAAGSGRRACGRWSPSGGPPRSPPGRYLRSRFAARLQPPIAATGLPAPR